MGGYSLDTIQKGLDNRLSAQRQVLFNRVLLYLVLVIGAVVLTTPFLWMLSSSLKDEAHIWLYPPPVDPQSFPMAELFPRDADASIPSFLPQYHFLGHC